MRPPSRWLYPHKNRFLLKDISRFAILASTTVKTYQYKIHRLLFMLNVRPSTWLRPSSAARSSHVWRYLYKNLLLPKVNFSLFVGALTFKKFYLHKIHSFPFKINARRNGLPRLLMIMIDLLLVVSIVIFSRGNVARESKSSTSFQGLEIVLMVLQQRSLASVATAMRSTRSSTKSCTTSPRTVCGPISSSPSRSMMARCGGRRVRPSPRPGLPSRNIVASLVSSEERPVAIDMGYLGSRRAKLKKSKWGRSWLSARLPPSRNSSD